MSRALELWRPALAAGVQTLPVPEGGVIVRDARARGALYVTQGQAALLAWLDGERTFPQIVGEWQEQTGRLDPSTPFRLLERLHDASCLASVPREVVDLFRARGRLYASGRISRWLDRTLVRLPLAWRVRARASGAPRVWLTALTAALGLVALAMGLTLAATHPSIWAAFLDPLREPAGGGRPVIVVALGLIVAASVRGLFRAAYLSWAGLPPAAIGVRLRGGVPFIGVPGDAIRGLPRGHARRLAVVGLAAPGLWAGALLLLARAFDAPDHARLAASALVILLVDLCPFARSDMGALIESLAGVPMARRRVGRFLVGRLARNAFRRDEVSWIERRYVLLAVGWIAYAVGAGWLLGHWLGDDLAGVAPALALRLSGATLVPASGLDRVAALLVTLAFALALGLGLALSVTGLRVLLGLRPARRQTPPRQRQAVRPEQVEALVRQARPATSLAGLSREALTTLVGRAHVQRYYAGDLLIRQGDQDDVAFLLLEGEVDVSFEEESGLTRRVARLEIGHLVGEAGWLERSWRQADVRAVGAVSVLAITRQDVEALAADDPQGALRLRAGARLARHPAFAALGPAGIEALFGAAEVYAVAAGDVVAREGEPAEDAWFVLEGRAGVVTGGAAGARIASLGPGEIFGEIGVLRGAPRGASVVAEQAMSVVRIPADALREAIGRALECGLLLDLVAAEREEEVRPKRDGVSP